MTQLTYAGFYGMDNTRAADSLPEGAVVDAVDGVFDGAGGFVQRPGLRSVSAVPAHSLWRGRNTTLLVSGTSLCALVDGVPLPLAGGFSDQPVCYAEIGNTIYLSDGVRAGAVRDLVFRPWGVPAPEFTASVVGGALPAGAYKLYATWGLDDGSESGALPPVTLKFAEPSGVVVKPSSDWPATASSLRLYLTTANGTVPFLAASARRGAASCAVLAPSAAGADLQSALCDPAMPAQAVGAFGASVATGHPDGVRFSRPYQPELFDPLDHIATDSPVTCLAGLDGGMVVGTRDALLYFAGSSVGDVVPRTLRGIGVATQNPVFCDAGQLVLGDGFLPRGVLLVCADGVVHVTPDGGVTPLTQSKMRFPAASRAAGALVPLSGGWQFVFSIQETHP